MFKAYRLILAFIGISSLVSAQTKLTDNKYFTVTVSEEYKKEKFPYSMVSGGSPFQIFGAGENGFSYHEADRKKSVYGTFDNTLKRTEYKVTDHDFDGSEMSVEKTVAIGGFFREYINVFDGREKKQTLYYRELDAKTLTPSKEKTKVLTRSGKSYKSGGFQVLAAYSPNRTKLLVVTDAPDNGDGYQFSVFDQNFNLLWEGVPQLTVDGNSLSLNLTGAYGSDLVNLQVDDQGVAYCLGGSYSSTDGKEQKVYYGVRLENGTINYSFIESPKEDMLTPYLYLSLSKKGVPMVMGFFDSNAGDKEIKQNGVSYGVLNFDGGSTTLRSGQFSDEFIKYWWTVDEIQMSDMEMAMGKPAGFTFLIMKNIAMHDDGGFTMVGQNSSPFRSVGNIVLINIDKEGNVNWMNKVPVAQTGVGDQYMGFALAQSERYLYFLFNDEKKNADPNWNREKLYTFDQFANVKDHVATIAVCDMNDDGNVIRQMAWTPKDVGGTVSPMDHTVQVRNSFYVYVSDNGNKERVVEVKLKD
ncbi:MAG: hypothetical protein GC178_07450 [Flavobacteriales bacterium]|nr:hypothetical protein [Flavobacteriales bacterium]